MAIQKRFGLRTLLVLVGISAVILGAIVVPRKVEQQLHFSFSELGSMDRSEIFHRKPTVIDSLVGFDGFVEEVNLCGSDPRLSRQLDLLHRFTQLNALRAYQVDFTFQSRSELQSLQKIEFSYCSGDFINSVVCSSPNLRQLTVWDCLDLTDEHLTSIRLCKNLREIRIDGASVSGTFLAARHGSEKIVTLELLYTPVSKDGVLAISGVTSLKSLSLHSDASDLPLRQLVKLKQLEVLDLVDFDDSQLDVNFLRSQLGSTKVFWR